MPNISNYSPYDPNSKGLVEALIDFKDTLATRTPFPVPAPNISVNYRTLEAINQGEAVYLDDATGRVGKAVANSTVNKATVAGFARTSKLPGEWLEVLVVGVLSTSGLDAGDIYYLSSATPGLITTTAPSTVNYFVTRVGESATSSQLCVQIEPPIQLR